ncbi:MAG TPA: ATP-binding cassette domain-containing protein [Solirubrobacteraceae bacterium]|nr:ATP-binding cassette domain-containing protein [Solirubrobacteraceae bacterium]
MIEAQSLTKRYGGQAAVQDVSFGCLPGTITGFLGPNGAGKSTTMKMLCGLAEPSSGRATILGAPFRELPNPGRRIGVLIDASAQHSGRRGAEVLGLSAQLMGVDRRRVDQMLELVGLDQAAARKRVGQYSLGMRQRLGIAHALLGDPQVLILDEPANGLDPEGMRWMRELLRDFAQRGGTVLLSSHLLREVEAIADRVVVIARGRIVAQGTARELLSDVPRTAVRAAGGYEAADRLRHAIQQASIAVREEPDGLLLVDADPDEIGYTALQAGIPLQELRLAQDGASLEELFFQLTADDHKESR